MNKCSSFVPEGKALTSKVLPNNNKKKEVPMFSVAFIQLI